jgi:hypothetical protein
MKINLYLLTFIVLAGCYSSREYYKRGDYYQAVAKSVERLKHWPSHTRSREVLQQAYPLALQTLEAKTQNLIVSHDPFKYKNSLLIYTRINSMYEMIHSSPAALEVIPEPKNYYREVGELREKAADETYSAGIQAMMKGTRTDSRIAYQYFVDANRFVPRYKEVVELLCKSEDEATLRIVWQQSSFGMWWSSSDVISAIEALPFVDLQPMSAYVYSDDPNKKNVELELKISVGRYSEDSPSVTSSSENLVDSVKVGEKKGKNGMVPIMEAIKGTHTEYKKTVESKGTVSITISDKKTGSIVFSREYAGRAQWTGTWTKCEGDRRVFASKNCNSSEPNPDSSSLREQAREQIQTEAIRTLENLLADY